MVGVLSWRNRYPMVTAWLGWKLFCTVAMTVCIWAPVHVTGALSRGALTHWAQAHTILNTLLVAALIFLPVSLLATVLCPNLHRLKRWPRADRRLRLKLERRLADAGRWRIFAGFLGVIAVYVILVSAPSPVSRWLANDNHAGWVGWLSAIPFFFLLDLYPHGRIKANSAASGHVTAEQP